MEDGIKLQAKFEKKKEEDDSIVRKEIENLILDRLISRFNDYCKDIKGKIHQFVILINERSKLGEDAVPNTQLLIDELQSENKDLEAVSEAFASILEKLRKFNEKLKPLESNSIPTSEQTDYGTFQSKIGPAEKNVTKVHDSYFKVCSTLGLNPDTEEAMQIYSEMSPRDVQEFIKAQAGKQTIDAIDQGKVVGEQVSRIEKQEENSKEENQKTVEKKDEVKNYLSAVENLSHSNNAQSCDKVEKLIDSLKEEESDTCVNTDKLEESENLKKSPSTSYLNVIYDLDELDDMSPEEYIANQRLAYDFIERQSQNSSFQNKEKIQEQKENKPEEKIDSNETQKLLSLNSAEEVLLQNAKEDNQKPVEETLGFEKSTSNH